MIIKIDIQERDSFEKYAAIYGCETRFFTMENNPLMLQVEILDSGKEPRLSQMYFIGRSTAMEIKQTKYGLSSK